MFLDYRTILAIAGLLIEAGHPLAAQLVLDAGIDDIEQLYKNAIKGMEK